MVDLGVVPEGADAAPAARISKDRVVEANAVITKYSGFAFAGGVIPFPFMDIAAVTGVQIKMLADVAKLYDVEFVENWGKATLSSLAGGVLPHVLAVGTVGSLIKSIPILGTAIGFAMMPILSAAMTYAVGKVFVQHFESGGTFLDFDATTAKTVFRKYFAEGKEIFQRNAKAMMARRKAGGIDEFDEAKFAPPPAPAAEPAPPAADVVSMPAHEAPAPATEPAAPIQGEGEITTDEVPIRRRQPMRPPNSSL